jgi:hypothetical protein
MLVPLAALAFLREQRGFSGKSLGAYRQAARSIAALQ